jgi:hypothetical protein
MIMKSLGQLKNIHGLIFQAAKQVDIVQEFGLMKIK